MARAVVLIALLVGCGRIGFDDLAAGDDGGDAPLPTGRWQSVALGPGSACGITLTGELWCWGHGNYGQLGIGGTPELMPPGRVGADADWLNVAVDEQHGCGIRAGGSLWCWGTNTSGSLGYGIVGETDDVPRQVSPGSVWKQVQAGRYFTCAIRDDDTLWCWGANGTGQLGISSVVNQARPTMIASAATWTALAPGDETACAIQTDRSLWCWGDNAEGQVGDTTTMDRTAPTPVMPGTTWNAVDIAYQHACALDTNNDAWCWGRNYEGQLGNGTVTRSPVPVRVVGGKPFTRIATGATHSCAATADGELWCWGEGTRGRISGVDAIEVRLPQQVAAARVGDLEIEDDATCLIDDEAHLYCTGANAGGQLGIQPPGEHHTFERADTRTDWATIYAQISHACGLTTAGAAWCWGRGRLGQLGDGTYLDRKVPVLASAGPFDRLELGEITTAGFTGSDTLVWGYNHLNDTIVAQPTFVGQYLDAAVGLDHACGIDIASSIACMGQNDHGQLGDGTRNPATSPVALAGTWKQTMASDYVSCGISLTDALSCWGMGVKTGTGTTGDVLVPAAVNVPTPVTHVELGRSFGCALAGSGELWCWGVNSQGQVGDSTLIDRLVPVRVGSRTDWIDIDAGDFHACAIAADHTLWCWGHQDQGQIGTPSGIDLTVPTQITSDTDWSDVACGDHFTCAVKLDGTRWCTGVNDLGELGDDHAWITSLTVTP